MKDLASEQKLPTEGLSVESVLLQNSVGFIRETDTFIRLSVICPRTSVSIMCLHHPNVFASDQFNLFIPSDLVVKFSSVDFLHAQHPNSHVCSCQLHRTYQFLMAHNTFTCKLSCVCALQLDVFAVHQTLHNSRRLSVTARGVCCKVGSLSKHSLVSINKKSRQCPAALPPAVMMVLWNCCDC